MYLALNAAMGCYERIIPHVLPEGREGSDRNKIIKEVVPRLIFRKAKNKYLCVPIRFNRLNPVTVLGTNLTRSSYTIYLYAPCCSEYFIIYISRLQFDELEI